MNIISDVNRYLLTKITPYAPIKNNVFVDSSSEAIICRMQPSAETIYLDESISGEQIFSYHCKSLNQVKAIEQLEAIIDALNIKTPMEVSDKTFIIINNVSLPVLVSYSDAKEYIFAAEFTAEYTKQGD